MKKILIIVHHREGRSPGQRFRIEHFMSSLRKDGYEIIFSNILNEKDDKIFYSNSHYFSKFFILIKCLFHRLRDLKIARTCDIVFVYREAFVIGTSFFEKQFSKMKAKLVFDFDDAIWLNHTSEGNKRLSWLKSSTKTAKICTYSDMVVVGNQHLADYALKYNNNVFILPTTIDVNYHFQQSKEHSNDRPICIGWTGSSTTIKHFEYLIPTLKLLKEKYKERIYFKLISDVPSYNDDIEVKTVKWSKIDEIDQLKEFDIGIMPLPNDEWSQGKCGFKGLQCMSLEIPTVMSAVGVNNNIIQNGENGFLASKHEDWIKYLSFLIEDAELRQRIGYKGRLTIIEKYSTEIWSPIFINKLNDLIKE